MEKNIPTNIVMNNMKSELVTHVYNIIRKNKWPPGVMVYILDSISKELLQEENAWLSSQSDIEKNENENRGEG